MAAARLASAVAALALLAATAPRAAHAQVVAGAVTKDMATSAPILEFVDKCSSGTFGVDFGVDQVCLFEEEQYKGKCVCVGPNATEDVIGAFRLASSEFGSARVFPGKAVNVVLDEYTHKIQSLTRDMPTRKPCNYFVVGDKKSVCVFEEANYFGRKSCFDADASPPGEFHTVPFEYQSLMVLPQRKKEGCIKAEIREGKFVTRSAALASEMESGGAAASTGAAMFNFGALEALVSSNGPYTQVRVVPNTH